MKPNFALSLSFEGIRLLHRAQDGWRFVGEVALDSSDLTAELNVLRETAAALAADGLHSKLIIPNDQIRYLKLEIGDADASEYDQAARFALDGATPYAVEDLAYDISVTQGHMYVAAVARETLAEAEAFATEHHFAPVSCVATPEDGAFIGEAFFGETTCAPVLTAGTQVQPDAEVIVVRGPVLRPEVVPEPVAQPEVFAQPEPVSQPEPLAQPEPVTQPEPAIAPAAVAAQPSLETVEAEPHALETVDADIADPGPTIGFASRRTPEQARKTPALNGATRDAVPTGGASALSVGAASDPSAPSTRPSAAALSVPATTFKPQTYSETDVDDGPDASLIHGFSKKRTPPPKQTEDSDAAPKSKGFALFGARKTRQNDPDVVGGKPRFLALVLLAVLLVFMAGVAAWASVFMEEGVAGLFKRDPGVQTVELPIEAAPQDLAADEPAFEAIETASLNTELSSEDAAVLDALQGTIAQPAAQAPPLNTQELEARYAATGIWPKAPNVVLDPATLVTLEDLYITSIDPVSPANDAVALPRQNSFQTDTVLAALPNPAPAGQNFVFDERGLVAPSAEGALTPDGVVVYAGRPETVPPRFPDRSQDAADTVDAQAAALAAENAKLAALRPKLRPGDLAEQNQRANLGGLTLSELGKVRPQLRPNRVQDQDLSADDAVVAALAEELPNPQAVLSSVRPDPRPRNFARTVAKARAAQPKETTRLAAVAPRTVSPKIPSSANVAKTATVLNAINLRSVNLIGVYGKPSSRRALIRLSNGRYQKVKVGDRIDGGRVSAIGDSELRYKKGSRNLTLKMPTG